MSFDVSPELDETLKNLDQAIGEFHQIKEKLKSGPVQEPVQATVATTALPVKSETA